MKGKQRLATVVPLSVMVALAIGAARLAGPSPAADMADAAKGFLNSLTPELRAKATIGFDEAARMDWHFVPRARPGVMFKEMTDAQGSAARALVRSALSVRGSLKAEGIRGLDLILREMERAAGGDGASRDHQAYTIAVYGTPGAGVPWGWKIEGHHLSLNFTMPRGEAVSVTPAFMGAHPAKVPSGQHAGKRILAKEEDLARDLARSLDEKQRQEGFLAGDVPREIFTLPGRPLDSAPSVGLSHASMTPEQQAALVRLIEEYARNLREELAQKELDRIRGAGLDKVRFLWAGELEPGRPHYYRISGPTFVIEYDNTQNNADHIHTVWHDRERDFGKDLLRDHYNKGGHEHPHK